ncbi:MAG TPA: hypothetical protein VG206_08620 [Terriglobia bacterium]|nr:hypothetical protein [Terriglobia bacterium]
MVVSPSPDAVSEFNAVNNGLAAEYGFASGAVVNVVLKSESNQIYGDTYEFNRNSFFNATNPFARRDAQGRPFLEPAVNFNNFGGTIGGPLVITLHETKPTISTVPLPSERNGDFTGDPRFCSGLRRERRGQLPLRSSHYRGPPRGDGPILTHCVPHADDPLQWENAIEGEDAVTVLDNLTKVLGRHTVKTGFYVSQGTRLDLDSFPTTLSFSGGLTNNPVNLQGGSTLAQFLLGAVDEGSTTGICHSPFNTVGEWGFYSQDDFRIIRSHAEFRSLLRHFWLAKRAAQ